VCKLCVEREKYKICLKAFESLEDDNDLKAIMDFCKYDKIQDSLLKIYEQEDYTTPQTQCPHKWQ
jgi:hypothetical protein